MNRNTVLTIGILATIMLFGAAVALAQNTGENKNDTENQCTPEMMKDMPENCPKNMMQSGACENMMDGAKDCNEMMGNEKAAVENTSKAGESHCGDMDSGMGSAGADMKGMM